MTAAPGAERTVTLPYTAVWGCDVLDAKVLAALARFRALARERHERGGDGGSTFHVVYNGLLSPGTASVPLGDKENVTFIGALTDRGLTAPWALQGAMNGRWFLAYVEQILVPSLRPGVYSITFTLPGFNTIKREGIQLTSDFTASVNAEMKVGGVLICFTARDSRLSSLSSKGSEPVSIR